MRLTLVIGEIGGTLELVFDILSARVESPEPYLCCGRKNHCEKNLTFTARNSGVTIELRMRLKIMAQHNSKL